jgi:hypothetical protein
MQDDHRHTLRVATLFYIEAMPIANLDDPLVKRIKRGIEILHCALLA